MSHCYRTSQKTLLIAAVTKNAAIDLMYSDGPKTRRNRRHIAAVFAPAAITRFSCSVSYKFIILDLLGQYPIPFGFELQFVTLQFK